MKQRQHLFRAGFFTADIIVSLGILTLLGILLAGAQGRQNQAAKKLADTRSAGRMAERVLLDLQHHQSFAPPADVKLSIEKLNTSAPAGWSWAQVDAKVRGRSATLWGLVPDESLPAIKAGQ